MAPERRLWKAAGRAGLPRRLLLILLTVNVLLGCMAWFISVAGWPLVERAARAKMVKALGPGEYQAHVYLTSWWDLLEGHYRLLDVTGLNVRLKNSLPVARLTATVWSMDVQHDAIVTLGSASYSVRLLEGDLNDYLRQKSHSHIKPVPTVHLLDDEMEVSARGPLGIGLPVHVRGKVQVADEQRLNFSVADASLGTLDVEGPVRAVVEVLNPVVDLAELGLGLRIQRFDLKPGEIVIAGTAAPPLPFSLKPRPPGAER